MTNLVFTILHVSPHPDDELIGPPATLLSLRRAGHRVINLACSLGRLQDHQRRRRELEEASRRSDFELIVHEPPVAISRDDDRVAAQEVLTGTIRRLIEGLDVRLVVAPSPHDGHHGHEVVGRAVCDAVRQSGTIPLWLWSVWSSLPLPTLYVPFDDDLLSAILEGLAAYTGELQRNDYRDLVRGRSLADRVLGPETVFGYGSPTQGDRFAETLTELLHRDGEWWAGQARRLDPYHPLAAVPADRPLGWWVEARSFRDQLAALLSSRVSPSRLT